MEAVNRPYGIRIYKEYLNFSSSHFLIFADGTREPLHGHNYRVRLEGEAQELHSDMVFDFLDIKPIAREICNSLDHCLLLPGENLSLKREVRPEGLAVTPPDGKMFLFPLEDVKILPLSNTSAERLAMYISGEIRQLVWQRFQFKFKTLEVEVEETPGQSAFFRHQEKDHEF